MRLSEQNTTFTDLQNRNREAADRLSMRLVAESPASPSSTEAPVSSTIMQAVKSGNVDALRKFHMQGLDINIDQGELMATAAESGHLDLLRAMCEEMGGILTGSKCDYPFFRKGLQMNLQLYLDQRLRFETHNNIRRKPQKPQGKLSIFRISDAKIH